MGIKINNDIIYKKIEMKAYEALLFYAKHRLSNYDDVTVTFFDNKENGD